MVVETVRLPKMLELRQLARDIKFYPISGLGVTQWAEHYGYADDIIDFTKLFSRRMTFNSRTDLLNHCSLLERLLKEEHQAKPEHTQSPQED